MLEKKKKRNLLERLEKERLSFDRDCFSFSMRLTKLCVHSMRKGCPNLFPE